jgi:NAD(P)-dependent dehydrogenase (short-subunit alcohol dehydrogenase family)
MRMDSSMEKLDSLFDIRGRVVVVTGGTGVLGGAMASYLAQMGARVAILSRHAEKSSERARVIQELGGDAIGVAADVLDRKALERAVEHIAEHWGPVDVLINAAGGNQAPATTSETRAFFDLEWEAIGNVMNVNFAGTVQCCQVFGKSMVDSGHGCIVNIASMSAIRPLTGIPAYSAAKAAVVNFTQWLATHMAEEYSPQIRVNALAPGFFLTEQNRYLLEDAESGRPTSRAVRILQHTPMRRMGNPPDLLGPLVWLISTASAFVTGTVVPVDGGFSAFGGV